MTQFAQSKEEQLKQLATAGEADLHPVQWGAVSTSPPRSSAGGEINIGLSWYFSTEEGREVGSAGLPFLASLGTMEVILRIGWVKDWDLVDLLFELDVFTESENEVED